MDHHVVFTTPYVFVPNRNYDSVDKSIEEQWLVCFERIFPTLVSAGEDPLLFAAVN